MLIRLSKPLLTHSFFLFGARGVGKTSLLKHLLGESQTVLWFNLLDDVLYTELVSRPQTLEQRILAQPQLEWVVIDEVQRIPSILNTVHKLIEEKKIKFALTGSSARKLKKNGANLLGGRALINYIHPMTSLELKQKFNLDEILNWGSLPYIINTEDELTKKEILKAYVALYLRQEIKEEQLVRQLDPFLRFLEVAAQHNGKIINATKIGREANVETNSVIRYFDILVDTLLGFYLEPFHTSVRKIQTAKSKFYFFDVGVKRALENSLESKVIPQTFSYGNNFEHFFILECIRLNDYFRKSFKFYYLATKDNVEIDLIVQFPNRKIWCIEIKSANRIDETGLSYALAVSKDLKAAKYLIACNEPASRISGSIEIHPWKILLEKLFQSDLA